MHHSKCGSLIFTLFLCVLVRSFLLLLPPSSSLLVFWLCVVSSTSTQSQSFSSTSTTPVASHLSLHSFPSSLRTTCPTNQSYSTPPPWRLPQVRPLTVQLQPETMRLVCHPTAVPIRRTRTRMKTEVPIPLVLVGTRAHLVTTLSRRQRRSKLWRRN